MQQTPGVVFAPEVHGCFVPTWDAQARSIRLLRPDSPTRPRRIALYSHDTQGLGHMRRNLLLAQTMLRLTPRPNILLIGGARELGALVIPDGIDCLTLPALRKQPDGQYHPRSLSISLRRIIAMRTGAIRAAVESFDPDLLIVDKVPLGAFHELEPALEWLKHFGRARCVLGLREVLDEPEVVRREWATAGTDQAICTYYDSVWVYGDPTVYDPAHEYGFSPEVNAKLVYTGYIDRSASSDMSDATADALWERLNLPDTTRIALCCVGGGQDGFELAYAFARAPMPADTTGVIITGPFMSSHEQQCLHEAAARHGHMRVLTFVDEPAPLLRRADTVVAMAGYNTTCEVLAFAKRALLVPRVHPRREQLIRAQRLRDLRLVDMLHPQQLSPAAIGDWLARREPAPADVRTRVNMRALDVLPELVYRLAYRHFAPRELCRAYG